MTKALTKKESAVVLVSGGVESSVMVWDALNRYQAVFPLYIQNELYWEKAEVACLKNYLRHLKTNRIKPLKVLNLAMRDIYEKHWSITGIHVPGARSRDESVYLPGRNIVLLVKAAIFASLHGVNTIEIGVLKGNPFTDSSEVFFKKMADVLSLALSHKISIKAPFRKLKKEGVLLKGRGLPLEFTFSCIHSKNSTHCGACNKCIERKKAFLTARIPDKTKYKK